MGKKQRNHSPQAQDMLKVQKKPLKQFLPHNKYVKYRNKILKKHTTQAISFINLDKNQILKAVENLKIFQQKNISKTDLFGQEGYIFIQIDVSMIPQQYSVRPIQIKLPQPIYSKELYSRFTVIVSDPEDEFIQKIQNLDIPMINQVIGYQKIKKHYRNQKQKQKLLAANDLFFCDWKIYNLLRQPLGKLFYQRKRFPYPIDCQQIPEQLKSQYNSYEEYLNGLANSTYFMMGNGPVYTVKIARTQMKNKDIVKNIMHGAYKIISHLRRTELTFQKIRQISIKTYNSPSLPIYNYLSPEQVKMYQQNTQ